MNEVDEAEEKIEVSIKALLDFSEKLKELSNLAWVASESFKKLVKAKEDVEKARKLMFSQSEIKKEPSKEAQESLDAWLGDDY